MPDVTAGIIDTILHPPVGSLTPHLDGAGPHTGNVTLTTFSSTLGPIYTPSPIRDTNGVIVTVASSIPEPWGRDIGYSDPLGDARGDYYHNRIAQLVVQHQLRMSTDVLTATGPWMTTQQIEMHSWPILILWEVALPGRLGIHTSPGIELDLYFLLILDS